MKGINKLGKVITKILEVFHWVGAALMTAATVCSMVAPGWNINLIGHFWNLNTSKVQVLFSYQLWYLM